MSNGNAIGATTAVIRRLFEAALPAAGLSAVVGSVTVSALPPDRIEQSDVARLNLFLFQVTPNLAWTNTELPSRDSAGRLRANAPVALDLHYVVSAYAEHDTHAEILLGQAALVLHENAILDGPVIRDVFSTPGSLSAAERALLGTSGLDAQEEPIRLSPQQLSVDEISKLWSVLGEHYRPSIAFTASVLLLRAEHPAQRALPVREPQLRTVQLLNPTLTGVAPQLAVAGDTLVLSGSGLVGAETLVRFGGSVTRPPSADSTGRVVKVVVPANLPAGLTTVQVVQQVSFGAAGTRRTEESNLVAFVVRPALTNTTNPPALDIEKVNLQSTAKEVRGTLRVGLTPPVGRDQSVRLLLNQSDAPPQGLAHVYSFDAPLRAGALNATATSIDIPFSGVAPGHYFLRVVVDGGESALTSDAIGRFDSPVVTLP